MADNPPFMNAYGNVARILEKIKEAKTPPRFTQDFLETNLGFSGGSSRPFIPLAKRLGLLASDGTPTDLYRAFRNDDESKRAMAQAIRQGFTELFTRNEYADKLDKTKLTNLVTEMTGLEKGSQTVRSIVGTFLALKAFADFEVSEKDEKSLNRDKAAGVDQAPLDSSKVRDRGGNESMPRELRLNYSVYLNLPNTTDIAVFNAIFKSLRENLLS